MKRSLKALALILIYLLFSAKSCDDREQYDAVLEQERLTAIKDSISSTMGSDTLTFTTLRAFEVAAEQKFSDFSDYANILADTSFDPAFKEQAKNMITSLFISDRTLLRLTDKEKKRRNELTINEWTRNGKIPSRVLCTFIPDSVRVLKSFNKVNDSIFSGKLGFSLMPSPRPGVNQRTYCPVGGEIDIFLAKQEKKFGTNTLKVWDVFLGDMELR